MKRVYTASTPMMAAFFKDILENAGIDCIMKNYFLSSATGELPVNETWPELWVKDADETRARDLITATTESRDTAGKWSCPNCEEILEGQFLQCWNCGTGHGV